MKKLLFIFTVIAAMSFASCGNKVSNQSNGVDSDSIATDSVK